MSIKAGDYCRIIESDFPENIGIVVRAIESSVINGHEFVLQESLVPIKARNDWLGFEAMTTRCKCLASMLEVIPDSEGVAAMGGIDAALGERKEREEPHSTSR